MTLRVLVITGPTASGKTRLGVEAAHRLRSEILSADSRQVYRGLDIGSGKDLDEYAAVDPPVRHHLIDVADPYDPYSLFLYQRACYEVLAEAATRAPFDGGTPLLMVGGSGLYIEAVLQGYRIANVPEDVALRERLMERDHAELVGELEAADPAVAARTDLTSHKRVVRALEIVAHARRAPVETSDPPPVRIDHRVFVVELPRDELERRIDRRLDARLEAGLVDEVRGLLAAGVTPVRMAQLGLEYREVAAFLDGTKSFDEMRDDLARGIRRLAKRQRTWFRGFARRGIPSTTIAADDVDALVGVRWDG